MIFFGAVRDQASICSSGRASKKDPINWYCTKKMRFCHEEENKADLLMMDRDVLMPIQRYRKQKCSICGQKKAPWGKGLYRVCPVKH
jgi:hypothetical protein